MTEEPPGENQYTLARAQETIVRQQEEIQRLKRRLADERFAHDLQDALTLAAAAGTIGSPLSHSRLLEMIVETAAYAISARAAALFLIDEKAHELVFEVAVGPQAEKAEKYRMPMENGIAGLVAMSGQTIAVSDVERDPHQAADIARRVGYTPQSILCVPLFYHNRVIGGLELLDKEGAPSFSTADMQYLGLFANQAAVAIEQSWTNRNLTALLIEVLERSGEATEGQRQELQERARVFAQHLEEDPTFSRTLDMARLVQEIVHQGENELKGCQAILRDFAEYLRSRLKPMGELGDRQ